MQSSLNQLDDQAILLLFLADELSPADRIAVEARLAAEESFRIELEVLRNANASVMQSLAALDARQPISGAVPAQRELLRRIKQWHVRRTVHANANATSARKSRRMRISWLLPLSGVAAALLGGLVWWSFTSNPQLPLEDNLPIVGIDRNAIRVSLQLDSRDTSLADDEQEMDALTDLRGLTR